MGTFLVIGAGSGIGAATALRLDADGHRVFAGVHDPSAGGPLTAGGPGIEALALDVTSPDSIARAIDRIAEAAGTDGLDGLVNNAGIGVPGPLEAVAIDDLREQLEVNVIGQVAVTQRALPLLRRARGRIVFVGSVGGRLASQFAGAYHASRFAIEAIADVWRQELRPEGLEVVVVEPAAVSAPIWAKAVAALDELLAADGPALARYRQRIVAFRRTLTEADERGQPARAVADVIAEALTTDRPDTRYVVGAGGRVATALAPLLPPRWAALRGA